MQHFSLTTWSNDRLVAYEPLRARTAGEVVAFAHGMLTERARYHTNFLAKMGVRYVLDHGERSLDDLATSEQSMIGAFHVIELDQGGRIVWQPNEAATG